MTSIASEPARSAALPLFALATGAFCIGVTEFSPMGMLPQIAAGVDVSIAKAGLLISAYAIGVMAGAPLMTLALRRTPQRLALIALVAIYIVGNLLSAMAPGYSTLAAARVLTSLCHGAFFGIGAVLAASLVAPERQASALAAMFLGLTIANIGGVPAATYIGQIVGWRTAFIGMAGLGLLSMAALWRFLPEGSEAKPLDLSSELAVLTRGPVLIALGTTVLSAGAMFALYTYVAPILETLSGASGAAVTLALALIGVGFTIGNVLGGRLADWSLDRGARIVLAALALIMFAFPLALPSLPAAMLALVVWGAAAFGVVPFMQMRVLGAASEAPGLASAVNIGAFNLGNALGAALGSAVIASGLGYAAIAPAGGLLAAGALALVVASSRR